MSRFFGILGGLGPQATINFMQTLIERTVANKDQDHMNYIAFQHATIPDRTAFILKKTEANPFPYLKEDAKKLENMKVDFIVMPCNTAHYFYNQLQNEISVPIINMIDETIIYIKKNYSHIKKIGVLATEGTIRSHLYNDVIEKNGMTVIPTPIEIQQTTNILIYDQIKKKRAINQDLYLKIINQMISLGCELIILGCTELSVINSDVGSLSISLPIVDAQQVLVEKTIRLCRKNVVEQIKVV
ncbi:aspartate/glutamate racemase family protein [Virgibacillus pantothenticus]|uniref:aspartate/glutamate racemase family protein n=1 Tax=Virgibacillus pantothenticus TaxID=1473 RepID=UPI00148023BC|nr:amino acid racemase [Virgibacillus pantothenticus]